MGDLIGEQATGALWFVEQTVFERVLRAPLDRYARAQLFADLARINTLYMIARAGSGHIGTSFSSMELVAWLHLSELPPAANTDSVYFSSKGHDAPGLYAIKTALGELPFDGIHRLRRRGGLPGHPDVSTPGIVTNTGSLGMGISKAKGMAFARRLRGQHGRIFVLLGDGELQEGQIWESLQSAARDELHELVAIVDHNKLQSDSFVARTNDLGDLEAKFGSFGWNVLRVNGHDLRAFDHALQAAECGQRPTVILADTVKGKGVSFMEHLALDSDTALYRFHSGAPNGENYRDAFLELRERVTSRFDVLGLPPFEFSQVVVPGANHDAELERLIPAYSRALHAELGRRSDVVVLDADLMVDTGQKQTRDAFPERFVECGIAEMDMVSQAGGMALMGALPICHSFASFLSSRPNEQIYNNATERTKIVYVGSLAGVLPGGPGHSHQAVRDIAALSAIPGLEMLEPCCEAEVELALDYCVNRTERPTYLRLVSTPWNVPFTLPAGYRLTRGRGVSVRPGRDAIVFGYGPILLSEAVRAHELLEKQGISIEVIALPWLNQLDFEWLTEVLANHVRVVTLDNHSLRGGQGQLIASSILECGLGREVEVLRLGVEGIPQFGSSQEVLSAHGLDAEGIARRVADWSKASLAQTARATAC
jgi:transketolase